MFSHLAVGFDGSINAEGALNLALAAAARLGSVVHGIHVIDTAILEGSFIADMSGAMGVEPLVNLTPQVDSVLNDVADTLRAHFEDRAKEAGIEGRFHVVRGSVAPSIVRESAACALLFVGRRGVNAKFHGDLLGPVTERLLRISRIPVVVAPDSPSRISRILIAYDGGTHADRALRWGGELARALSVPVTVLTVTDDEARGEELLSHATEYLGDMGLDVTTRRASGRPSTTIELMAGETGADLICMGSHGHSKLVEMVIGSTADAVLRKTDISVMCVP
ncbi:MAG: universal stress protein [Acidobacteria bacterium]|nr:universal stress protein [Acidobacteriota bacterium]